MRTSKPLLATAVLALAVGCNKKDADTPATNSKDKPAASASAKPTEGKPTEAKPTAAKPTAAKPTEAKPAAAPADKVAAKPAAPAPGAIPEYAGSHILVAYKGAQRAKPTITRTKEEALARAKELAKTAREGAVFERLANENSDGPSASRGGSLGSWKKGRMVPAFDTAVSGMKIGEISEPVETPFGYHVIKRNALPEKRSGAHILIAYKGAMRAKPTITRTKEEALAKAKEIMTKARANPADFGKLAGENSDGPSASRGGSLGTWPKGKMVPEFDKAIDTMKVGDISEPVETPFGFHVIQRREVK